MLDENLVVDGIAEVCRHRSVTHLIVAASTYRMYSLKLTDEHKKKGIKHSICHGVSLLPVKWIPVEANHVVLGFNPQRSKKLRNLQMLAAVEEDEMAEDIATEMLESEYRYLHAFHLAEKETGDEAT